MSVSDETLDSSMIVSAPVRRLSQARAKPCRYLQHLYSQSSDSYTLDVSHVRSMSALRGAGMPGNVALDLPVITGIYHLGLPASWP